MLLVAEGKKQLSKEADPKEREKIQEGITNNERGAYELRTEIHSNRRLTTLLKRPGLYNVVITSIQYPVLAQDFTLGSLSDILAIRAEYVTPPHPYNANSQFMVLLYTQMAEDWNKVFGKMLMEKMTIPVVKQLSGFNGSYEKDQVAFEYLFGITK